MELLYGEIVEIAPEGVPHASTGDRVERYLRTALGNHAWIRVGKPITLPNHSELEPDLCICQDIEYNEHYPCPENIFWLIEFSDSSLAKDLQVKPKTYAAAGIPEYWVVNLQAMTLMSFGCHQPRAISRSKPLPKALLTHLPFLMWSFQFQIF